MCSLAPALQPTKRAWKAQNGTDIETDSAAKKATRSSTLRRNQQAAAETNGNTAAAAEKTGGEAGYTGETKRCDGESQSDSIHPIPTLRRCHRAEPEPPNPVP